MAIDGARWQARLDELTRAHGVPGAALAVLAGGETWTGASGVLNLDTGVAATPDSVFQIGSITKVYTTTLVMQLVDEGLVALDQPVVELLPELRLGDAGQTAKVTVRQLFTHTSGIQGDHFEDTGRGDDCVERYVATCATLGFSHPVGATFSYCNTGFVIAGRLLEVLRGRVWDAVLRERLIEPLGLERTVTLPEEAIRYRAAHGHVSEHGGPPCVAPRWVLPRSAGPAGLICATARDVLSFGRLHLAGGVAPDGTRLLSEAGVAAMRTPQVDLPPTRSSGKEQRGLGWSLTEWDGHAVLGHDGGTIGQFAFLRVVPDAGVAVALLTNGGHVDLLSRDVLREVFAEVGGIAVPPPLEPPAARVTVALAPYPGTYERAGLRMRVAPDRDGRLMLTRTMTGAMASLLARPEEEMELVPVREHLFLTRPAGEETWMPVTFYRLADGTPYLYTGGRAAPRVSD
jgi:CubicO group peptidase (beta-lactamase class C family)